jgi:hypothetical protein
MSSQGRISALRPFLTRLYRCRVVRYLEYDRREQSRRDQSHVNTRHDVLDWFETSCEVILLRPVLMYYAIEIDSSLFLSGSFEDFSVIILDMNLSSLFIVGESPHRV